MKKAVITLVLLLVVVGIVSAYLHVKNKPSTLATVSVSKQTIVEKVVAVGNITPKQTISVKSPIPGTVARLYHDEGDYVSKGEKLLQIKPEPTPTDYATAKQQVAIDASKVTKDQEDVARYRLLLREGAISKTDQDYAVARSQYQQDTLTKELDQQKLSLLEAGKAVIGGREVENTIVSPENGYILLRNVSQGDPVVPQTESQPGNVLFTIANMKDIIFKGQVSQTDVAKLHLGMPATIEVAAIPTAKISGQLTKLSLQSVQAAQDTAASSGSSSGSASNTDQSSPFSVGFTIEISDLKLPNDIKLRAGYSANADINIKTVTDVLALPERVIQFDGNQAYVWLPNGEDKPKKQLIKLGISDGVNVQILSGLNLGEKVVAQAPSSDQNDDS